MLQYSSSTLLGPPWLKSLIPGVGDFLDRLGCSAALENVTSDPSIVLRRENYARSSNNTTSTNEK